MRFFPDELPRTVFVREGCVAMAGVIVVVFTPLDIVRVADIEFSVGVFQNVSPEDG